MKRAALIALLLAAAASAASGQEPVAPPRAADAREAIAASHSKFVGAFGKGDAAALAALHAADVKLLPQGGRPVEGVPNVEAFWASLIKSGARLVQLQTLSVEERGELAYEGGDYILTTRPQPGLTSINSGNYLAVWRRQGEEWRVAALIWNSDGAEPQR